MDKSSKNIKNTKQARTFMPEILAPGTGLTPLTEKSIIPTNNVTTIQDILNGQRYRIHGGGGDWSSDWGEDVSKSYKDSGDAYKRDVRDLDILKRMTTPSLREQQQWKIKVPGGYEVVESFELAMIRKRQLLNKGVKTVWISRAAQSHNRSEMVSSSLVKTFMIESFNVYDNVKEVGSAFCIAPNTFMTCAHVIKKYDKNRDKKVDLQNISSMVKTYIIHNGKRILAKTSIFDPIMDVAILIANIDCDIFELDTTVNIGDNIMAVGSPHGFENNVTFGTIGSLNRKIYTYDGAPDYMFVDLSAFPGNSGGPIVKENNGKVVGMLTAIVSSKGDYGLNAGLPSKYLEQFIV